MVTAESIIGRAAEQVKRASELRDPDLYRLNASLIYNALAGYFPDTEMAAVLVPAEEGPFGRDFVIEAHPGHNFPRLFKIHVFEIDTDINEEVDSAIDVMHFNPVRVALPNPLGEGFGEAKIRLDEVRALAEAFGPFAKSS